MSRPTGIVAGGYTLLPEKFYHPNASRNALGLVGGNEVSVASGNLVDLESEMFNITRDASRAPARQYQPGSPGQVPNRFVFVERSNGKVVTIDNSLRHLPTTQFVSYPGVPAPLPFVQEVYGMPWRF